MDLLIIEDNRDIHDNLLEFFELRGHNVAGALDGLTGLHLAATRHFDAIVLDVMLPGIDGNKICHSLRHHSRSQAAILMLSARDELEDRLTGLGMGADDYVTKPFAMTEVLARLEAIVSRRCGTESRILEVADLRFDLDTLQVSRAGATIRLNRANMKMLEALMRRSPHIVRRNELESLLWGDATPNSESLRSSIHVLRRVIDKPFDRPLLQTVHGIGYKLCP